MPFEQLAERVHLFRDVCNVFVVTSGRAALLFELGTGAVLDAVGELGVDRIDWVLLTHHHRDQSLGAARLAGSGIALAVPEREARWFERADATWQDERFDDRYDCTNVFDRPLADIPVDRRLRDYERFRWEDLAVEVVPTPGHTKGHAAYLLDVDGTTWAFTGDLIHSPGRVWTLHDLHWNYSDPDGLDAELHSVHVLRGRSPARIAPSHGEVLDEGDSALAELERNLRRLLAVVGGRFLGDLNPLLAADSEIERVTPHLLTVKQTSANFHVLLGPDGRALFFDYGFPGFLGHVASGECRFVEHTLAELRRDFGVTSVEVAVVTHYHDDHVAGLQFLRDRFGTEVWTLDLVADVISDPRAVRLPATWHESVPVDRTLTVGETFAWHGHAFEVRHLPGHTWYAGGYFGEVDGRRIGVTGDEIQLDGAGRLRGGGPVYQNGFRLDSFRRGVEAVTAYAPEVLLTGHDGAVPVDETMLAGMLDWCDDLEGALTALGPGGRPIGFALDPACVAVRPYRATGRAGRPLDVAVEVTNHGSAPAQADAALVVPPGWDARPRRRAGSIPPGDTSRFPFTVVPPDEAPPGKRFLLGAEVSLDGGPLGMPAEGVVTLEPDQRQATARAETGSRTRSASPTATSAT